MTEVQLRPTSRAKTGLDSRTHYFFGSSLFGSSSTPTNKDAVALEARVLNTVGQPMSMSG